MPVLAIPNGTVKRFICMLIFLVWLLCILLRSMLGERKEMFDLEKCIGNEIKIKNEFLPVATCTPPPVAWLEGSHVIVVAKCFGKWTVLPLRVWYGVLVLGVGSASGGFMFLF